jgi:hypothetical protein
MKRVVPVPAESVERLRKERSQELGYQFVWVELKDGRRFDPAIVSEDCIIAVKGYKDVPFTAEDVASVTLSEKRWNFRGRRLDQPFK